MHNIKYINSFKLSELIPYAKNARTHTKAQIKQIADSMVKFGYTNKILIDEDGGIIAGHGRALALDLLKSSEYEIKGFEDKQTIEVFEVSGLSEDEKRALIIADNKIALNADWDKALLREELEALKNVDFDLSLTGFSEAEFLDILAPSKTAGMIEDDEVPSVSTVETVTQPGNIWKLGKHKLMCGDSTNFEDVQKLMDGDLADMLLTDPPYNVDQHGKNKGLDKIDGAKRSGSGNIENDNLKDNDFKQLLLNSFVCADSFMKKGAVFYIWHSDIEGFNFRKSIIDVKNWTLKQCLIWAKNQMILSRSDYHWQHEPCLYGWKDGATHLWAADRKQTTLLHFDKPPKNDLHPTMKPVALFEYQILNNTKGSDIVLDLFGGSGTTIIACEKNSRHGRVMELSPFYCDVIIKRWEKYTGAKAILMND